jgi:hypothetical protein
MLRVATLFVLISAALYSVQSDAVAIVTARPNLTVGDGSCSRGRMPCEIRFTGNHDLYPGGLAARSAVELAYVSHNQAANVQLYVSSFDERSLASTPLCTAYRPAALFDVAIESEKRLLYTGSLDALAQLASTPAEGLSVPAPRGHQRWLPGDREQVLLSIGLNRSADNSYMGCSVQVAFGWLVST